MQQKHLSQHASEQVDCGTAERPLVDTVTPETKAERDAAQQRRARREFLMQIITQDTKRQTRNNYLLAALVGVDSLLVIVISSYFWWTGPAAMSKAIPYLITIPWVILIIPCYFWGRPSKQAREAMQELAQIEEQPLWKSLLYPLGMDSKAATQVLRSLQGNYMQLLQESNRENAARKTLLRASDETETSAETLLRPVTESATPDPKQLLRPTSGEQKP